MELAGLNIKFLPGVGEKKAAVLYEELQVQSYEDMLYHVPFKYIDRSKIYSIAELNGRLPYIQIKAKSRNLKNIGEGKALRITDQPNRTRQRIPDFRTTFRIQPQAEYCTS